MSYTFQNTGIPSVPDGAADEARGLIDSLTSHAQSAVAAANSAIGSMGSFVMPSLGAPPTIPTLTRGGGGGGARGSGGVSNGASNATDINITLPAIPAEPSIDTSSIDVEVPTFNGSVILNIPTAPGAIDTSGAPTRPAVDTSITLPTAPTVSLPAEPNIQDVVVPAFSFPTLPVFSADAPEFNEATPNIRLEWNEPVYYSDTLDDLRAKVRGILAGGNGLPPAVEQALFDRARSREEAQVKKSVQEAFDTFAGRGFAMPPGMLVAQVNAAREEGQLRISGINRDIMIEAAKWQLESLRMAVEQGLAAETLMVQQFNNGVNRTFEAAKAVLDGQLSLYNAVVNLYNARQQGYQVAAQVYKTQIDAELSQIEVYKAQIEGVKVQGERNEQKVREYTARLQAVAQTVEVYKAQMDGAKTQADVSRSVIESYRSDVEAYAAKLQAEKTKFEAYESAVRGELAKAQILDVDARVFATRMQGAGIQADVKAKMVEADVAAINASTQRFIALLDRSKVELQQASERVQAKLGYMSADVQLMAADNDKVRAEREADIRIAEQQLQASIEAAKLGMAQYQAQGQLAVEQARVQVSAIQGAAQASATLAAGAMAAVHVGANVSFGTSIAASHAISEIGQEQTTTSRKA
jgi:hypothetical protein